MSIATTCPYCGVGCGVRAARTSDGAVTIVGDSHHPANFGRLCSKGSALAETLGLEDRLLYPEIRGQRASRDTALATVADGIRNAVEKHGPSSIAFYVSGQLLTEDYYVANKLIKGFLGTANIDTNSRLCMASAVAGQSRAFGEDVVPNSYEDLEQVDLLVLVGSSAAWCHPVLFGRMQRAKEARPTMKVINIDPRRTATSDLADLHLAIAPGTDARARAHLERDQARPSRNASGNWCEAASRNELRFVRAGVKGPDRGGGPIEVSCVGWLTTPPV